MLRAGEPAGTERLGSLMSATVLVLSCTRYGGSAADPSTHEHMLCQRHCCDDDFGKITMM